MGRRRAPNPFGTRFRRALVWVIQRLAAYIQSVADLDGTGMLAHGVPLCVSMHRRARLARTAIGAAIAAIGAAWLIGRFGPTGFPLAVLASYAFPPVYLAPLVAIILACGIARRLQLAAVALAALGITGYAEGARLSLGSSSSASSAGAAPPPPQFRVMTYNVAKWEGGALAIGRAVEAADADVVCLEEAGTYPWIAQPEQTPEALARALPAYRFAGDAEVRIASRLPIREARAVSLPAGPASRPMVVAVLDAGSRDVSVAAVHFIPTLLFQAPPPGSVGPLLRETAEARMQQAEAVLAYLEGVPGPVVLCGDFNAPPTAAPTRRIASRLRDAWTERGNGFGWTDPASLPSARIDYVFVRALRVDDVAAGCSRCDASDHLPVVAAVSLLP